jgi:prolipoprotein diacylglyceryltransferase
VRKRSGDLLTGATRWYIIAAAAAGGAIGSKVLYWFEDPMLTLARWRDPFFLMAGKTLVGGLLGGIIAVEWTKRRIGVARSTGDLFAIPLCVGIAIGRVGCFLTGLADNTYGSATQLPWGIDFGDGIRRHPTQLYEIVFVIALAFFLGRVFNRPHREGDVFKMFMVGYLSWRLATGFLSPDPALGPLTAIQWTCVAGLMYYGRDIRRWCTGAHHRVPNTEANNPAAAYAPIDREPS